MSAIEIRRIERREQRQAVEAARQLFDHAPQRDWTDDFLRREGHHLLIAYVDDDPAGFVTGIEVAHPDKGLEMLLYELGVDEGHRRKGVGQSLIEGLLSVARKAGCREMWVPIEPSNQAAIATYRSAGAEPPESAMIMSWQIHD